MQNSPANQDRMLSAETASCPMPGRRRVEGTSKGGVRPKSDGKPPQFKTNHALPILAAALLATILAANGQIEVLPGETPVVFQGEKRLIKVTLRNPAGLPIEAGLRTRLYQASSATIMPVAPAKSWKTLRLLARQTVLDEVEVDFPAVRARTDFQLHWFDDKDRVIAKTPIVVCPEDVLRELSVLVTNTPIGLFDPDHQMKPLLKRLEIEFQDLEANAGLDGFHGRLILVGPFLSTNSQPTSLGKRLAQKAAEDVAIVWMQPPNAPPVHPLMPVFLKREGPGIIILAQDGVVAGLDRSPSAQLSLLECVRMALHPETLRPPHEEL